MKHIPIDSCLNYLNPLLEPDRFKDYGPNGLQLAGDRPIQKMVTGVTASQAFIDAAIQADADVVLVHHGLFWNKDPRVLTGWRRERLKSLLDVNIHLLAYHLPLDVHPEFGNNAQLARLMGWDVEAAHDAGGVPGLLMSTSLASPLDGGELANQLEHKLHRKPLWIPGKGDAIKRIAWCTGAAQGFIQEAADLGVDAFVSGEISESTTHIARETGVHYFAAGHHATERYGVQAIGSAMAKHFGILHDFIDCDNPA